MHWTILIVSGLFEAMWALGLANRQASMLTRVTLFVVGCVISMGGLFIALQGIPVGTAYAVWVGVGAVSTLTVGVVRGEESLSPLRLLFVFGLVAGIVGLKVAS